MCKDCCFVGCERARVRAVSSRGEGKGGQGSSAQASPSTSMVACGHNEHHRQQWYHTRRYHLHQHEDRSAKTQRARCTLQNASLEIRLSHRQNSSCRMGMNMVSGCFRSNKPARLLLTQR